MAAQLPNQQHRRGRGNLHSGRPINATLLAVVGAQRLSADGRALLAHFKDLAVAEPRLTIEVDWVDTDPAEAIIDLSRAAQLLVVGAHHSADRWSMRPGPVTRVVLGRAHCPVITVGRMHLSTVPTRTAATHTSDPNVARAPIASRAGSQRYPQ